MSVIAIQSKELATLYKNLAVAQIMLARASTIVRLAESEVKSPSTRELISEFKEEMKDEGNGEDRGRVKEGLR